MDYGLLGVEDPKTLGLLSLGLRLMSTPGKFSTALGQSGLGALGDVQQRTQVNRESARRDALMKLQMEEAARRKAAEDAAAARQAAIESAYMQAIRTPQQQAMAKNGGPTVAAANAAPGMRPMLDQSTLIDALSKVAPIEAAKLMSPEKRKLMAVKPGDVVLDEADPSKPVFTAPAAPDKPPSPPAGVQEYLFAVQGGYKGSFEQWKKELRPPGTVVNLPNESWKNEGEVRKEFASLPEVTRYKASVPAYNAVKSAASRMGPQADINLVYAIAKLYDPESVVREGEYATIANSQAIPERVKGMAQYLAGNGKLTPETRKQLVVEAEARMSTLRNEYEGAKKTYDGIAKRRGLNPENIFTPVGQENKSTVKWGDLP